MTRSNNNNNDNKGISSVYEVLQEIKPEHPLRINTQFEFTTNNSRPTSSQSLLYNSISHNPLSHHHRNSVLYADNTSPTSTRNNNNSRRNSRNSANYTPPRRYSNIQRPSLTKSFYENKNDINNYFNIIQEKQEKKININNNNVEIKKNIYNNNINNNKKFDDKNYYDDDDDDDDDENKMYI
ncbi:hypothetical protein GLOIN_2v1618084, partial [Rhizophagus irregularis DAOM 181602=DAOM 197198]